MTLVSPCSFLAPSIVWEVSHSSSGTEKGRALHIKLGMSQVLDFRMKPPFLCLSLLPPRGSQVLGSQDLGHELESETSTVIFQWVSQPFSPCPVACVDKRMVLTKMSTLEPPKHVNKCHLIDRMDFAVATQGLFPLLLHLLHPPPPPFCFAGSFL